MNFSKACLVIPGSKVKLADWDPSDMLGLDKDCAVEELHKNTERLFQLQYRLYAQNKYALLVVFQAMDAGGKDGAIRHVMTGLNPQGCSVASFKAPSSLELDHDFLWRVHKEVPARGDVGIFNRSHYEEVLVVRVHDLVPKHVWSARYEQINAFERILAANNVVIVKFYLHISMDEQKRRFEDRIKDPQRNWKLSAADFAERRYWGKYRKAYEDALSRCSTKEAPWYVVPANHKWVRNAAISTILVETLEALDLKFPKPSFDLSKVPSNF